MAKSVSLEENSCTRIVWKIENFNYRGRCFSEEFNLFGSKWKFDLDNDNMDLRMLNTVKSLCPFWAISFIETKERLHKFCQSVEVKELYNGWKRIWTNKYRQSTEDAELFLGVVTFVLLCMPIADPGKEHKCIQTLSEKDHLSCLESLSSDFSNLLVNGTQPDVMVKCEDHTTPAHRLVLSARSEVFCAMFSNNMLETRTGTVDIVDLEQPVLNQLLQYIYTGKVHNLTVENAQSLYAAGNKYAVHELKNKCRSFMLENLMVENVCDLLVFSDIHSDQILKDAAIELFVENAEFLEGDTWLQFCDNQPRLGIEVYRVCFAKNSKSNKNTSSS